MIDFLSYTSNCEIPSLFAWKSLPMCVRDVMASLLMSSTPYIHTFRSERSGFEHWLGTLFWVHWARDLTNTVPLSTRVYEWIPENLLLGVTLWTGTLSRGVTRNTPLLLHATETGIRNHLARMNTSRTEATVHGRRYKKMKKMIS